MLSGLWRTSRPKQWLKNVLVFAAPGAAGVLDEGNNLALTIVAFVSFCFAASGIYIWNDLLDVEADRRHPTKCKRPIAAGQLSVGAARVAGVLFPVIALALAGLTGRWQTVAVVGTYIVITIAYTLRLKHVPVVDVVTVAAGFVLRAAAGAVAVDVPMSNWFVLCITFGSLFIVVGKRYAELNELGDDAGTWATLEVYSLDYLRMILAVSLAGVLISYCVWAFETGVGLRHRLAAVRTVDRADVDGADAVPAGPRAGWRFGPRGGLHQRPVAAVPRVLLDRRLWSRGLCLLISLPPTFPTWPPSPRSWTMSRVGCHPDRHRRCTTRPADARRRHDRRDRIVPGPIDHRARQRRARRARVIAIDPHAGNDRGPQEIDGFADAAADDHAIFNANLERAGVADRVRHVRMFSDAALDVVDGPIDVLYIDGAHRYAPAVPTSRTGEIGSRTAAPC